MNVNNSCIVKMKFIHNLKFIFTSHRYKHGKSTMLTETQHFPFLHFNISFPAVLTLHIDGDEIAF